MGQFVPARGRYIISHAMVFNNKIGGPTGPPIKNVMLYSYSAQATYCQRMPPEAEIFTFSRSLL